jgi:hypothetical protein
VIVERRRARGGGGHGLTPFGLLMESRAMKRI